MVGTGFKILIADAVLLAAEFLILQDLQWRSSYAAAEGLSPSYSYSVLTQFFAISGGGATLTSPPTLDWVQLLVVVLVVLNVWYAYRSLRRRNLDVKSALPA